MLDTDPIGTLLDPYRQPLTPEDVAAVEEGVNFLICYIYADEEEALEGLLEMDLPRKMREYIEVADSFKSDPKLGEMATILGNGMRDLLKRVNAYYYHLN